MEPNLLYWKSHGQSFFSRFQMWLKLADLDILMKSDDEISKAHSDLKLLQNETDADSLRLSLSSVHPDSGAVLPLVLRPAAVVPVAGIPVLCSFLPHRSFFQAVFWQLMVQTYFAHFNFAHRNSSAEQNKASSEQDLLRVTGIASAAACAATIPQILTKIVSAKSPQRIIRAAAPVPLNALLAAMIVSSVRSEEIKTGVKVFNSDGELVGMSKAAARKAVTDTAQSRAALFITTGTVPPLFMMLLQKARFFKRKSLVFSPLHHACSFAVVALMLPVSLSLFPQLGTIAKEELEEELRDAAANGPLYYHRGL